MSKEETTLEGLSKDDKKLIKQFVENEAMCNAVRKVLLQGIYREGGKELSFATFNWVYGVDQEMPNAEYGALVKVIAKANSLVQSAFVRLEGLAKPQPVPSSTNEAR